MITPNREQEFVIEQAVYWYYHSNEQVFQYDGGPGTGKSFVLMEIIKQLGLNILTEVAPMAFIGSASLVMRNKGLVTAKTAHSWLFDVVVTEKRDNNGNVVMDTLLNVPVKIPKFLPVSALPDSIKLIVIDEAYSLPAKLRPEIEKFGIKIIACGDQNQLPPVKDYPGYLHSGMIYHLTEVMRQQGKDDINYIANRVQRGLPLLNGYYGNSLVIDRSQLTDSMLMWADTIICGKNATRDMYNDRIRSILGYRTKLPSIGEKIVCRNNNWFESVPLSDGGELNLVNGLVGRVQNNPSIASFNGEVFLLNFVPDLRQDALFINSKCNYKHIISDHVTRKHIRENKYSTGNMFEYAYAITAHIAQGSQFHKVIYIEEKMPSEIQTSINLVGATRADMALIYVKQ